MSANSGTLPSSNKTTTKSGYDHLDINKLYKGKSAEPAPKTVTQKHGMQTLGKAPPARRAGGVATIKTDTSESPPSSLPTPIPQQQQQQQPQPPPGWVGPMPHPPKGPPPPPQHNHNVPGASVPGPGHDIKWSGGMQRGNGFPSQRFAQDFPSLEATGEPVKNQNQNHSGPPPGTMQSMSKATDNQYGPGPILRPQTEGSWTQGGGLGMQRPPGPMQSQNPPTRDFATDRSNLGGPTPPPMSLGQVGPIPPPLGAYPMSFRGIHPPPPYMYPQGSGPPSGPGNIHPPGPGAMRYGMPIPPGAPPPGSYPPGSHPGDGRKEDSGRGGRGPSQNQGRPGSHFTSTSIIRKDEMERMDEIGTQEGGWASTNDAIDYNKKINFSDDDEGSRDSKRPQNNRIEMREKDISEEEYDRAQGKPDKTSINERDREPQSRYDSNRQSRDQYEHENEDDRTRRRPFDNKDRGDRGGRRSRDEDWRSNSNRHDDDRGKKGPPGSQRTDPRGPSQDFQSSKYPSNIPPRFQRQNMPPVFNQIPNQRQTPSPVSTSTSGSCKDRDRDYRDRDWERESGRDRDQQNYRDREPAYKILERRKTDSESSKDSRDAKKGQSNDQETRLDRFQDKDRGKGRLVSLDNRGKSVDDTNKPGHLINNVEKEVNDLGKPESRTVIKDIIRKDDAKTAFRTRTDLSTSSWADEVEDEESSKINEDLDTRKGRDSHQVALHKTDDRQRVEPGPKRVYLTQRKVENLVTHLKSDQHAEQKFQPQPKKEEKVDEKNKSAWCERAKEKQVSEKESPVKEQATPSPEKEIVKSSSRDNLDKDKHRKDADRPREKDFDRHNRDNRERDFERRKDPEKHTDLLKPKDIDKPKEQDKQNKEFTKQKDNREFDKRERERPDRNDYDLGRGGGGGNPRYRKERERKHTPNWNDREKVKTEKEDSPVSQPIKEKTPEDKSTDDDKDASKEFKEPSKHEKEEIDERGDKSRGQRNRERSGYPVYQARGSWGNQGSGSGRGRSGRGGGGARNGSGGASGTEVAPHYDKPIKRPDGDRNRDEKENVREPTDLQPREPKKEKKHKEMTSGSSQDSGSKKDLSLTQEEKSTPSAAKKSNPIKEQDPNKKTAKSPSGTRRNGNARGGSRLQGYGPPSDRNPFSSNNPKQDEDQPQPKDKGSEGHVPKTPHPVTSGPVPLMALGEISPPEMPPRARHHGGNYSHNHRQHEGRAVPPRMRGGGSGDPSYSTRGGHSNKGRGGGNGNNDAAKPLMSLNSSDLDRNSGSGERVSEPETEVEGKKPTAPIGTQKKENPANKPYDARAARDMPPRFMSTQTQQRESPPNQPSAVGTGKPISENSSGNSFKEPAPLPLGNAWEKPITASLRTENQMPSTKSLENKDDLKLASHLVDLPVNSNLVHPVVAPIGQGSGNCAPVQTMIFENTNFKSGVGVNSKVVAPNKLTQESQVKKEITGPSQSQGLEMSKEFPLTFGEDTPKLDFGSSFSDSPTSNSTISSHSQGYSKPSALLQSSRSYGSHQSSPISPLAADLNEKIQAVKSMWDIPTMPSVAESGNLGSEEDVLPGGFGGDAFKRSEAQSREYGQSLQQNSSGFGPGAPPVMSAIAKPDSRSSPNSTNVRQIKLPQNQMESQIHAAVSSSPFTYGLAQPHQGANTFGIRAVPSPPSLMYGSSHSTTNPNAMYQAFPPHVDSSQVVGSNPRSQFPQYNAPVGNAGGAPYMGESLFLPMFNTPFYQQQQHQPQTHGIPPAQIQSQNSRISPGPMPMTSSSAGVVGGGVMMNSNANSIMSMKSGQPGGMPHQNIGHQVHPGSHQQGYSQFGHPHMAHPQHHLGPVGHQKPGYSQNSMPAPSQVQHLQFLPFDPNQQPVLTLGGQNYLTQGMRSGHGGPPPSATPPVQGLQSSSPFYGSAGTQSGMYGGSSQGGTLQPLHVAVAQGSQQMPGLRLMNQNQPQKKKWTKSHYP